MANKVGKGMSSQLIKRENETPPFAYHISKSQRKMFSVNNSGNVNFKGHFIILIKNVKHIPLD